MTFLLDTNIISELRKTRPHGAVLAWRRSIPTHQLAIPAVEIAEIQNGIEITRKQDEPKAHELERWLDEVMAYYMIVPADGAVFRQWARLMSGKTDDLGTDALIAATARVNRMVVATRNIRDFKGFNIEIFNPFMYTDGGES